MERRSCLRLSLWTCSMHDGCCWFQSKMVGDIPRYPAQCFQCIRQQLVERAHRAPSTGLPQVRATAEILFIYLIFDDFVQV